MVEVPKDSQKNMTVPLGSDPFNLCAAQAGIQTQQKQ